MMSQYVKRRTMVKDQVGRTRYSTYDLPDENFVFGRKNVREASNSCGAGSPPPSFLCLALHRANR